MQAASQFSSMGARSARAFVIFTVASVALLDLGTGLWLLASPEPWLAHGTDTVWTMAADEVTGDGALSTTLLSLWRRIGSFSVFAGLTTLVWLARGLRDPGTLSTLLVVYIVAGLSFGYTDATFFAGTPYLTFKRVIGAFWFAALVAHFWSLRAARAVEGAG